MIVWDDGKLRVEDDPSPMQPYRLRASMPIDARSSVARSYATDEIRDLRDALSDWLERCGR